MKVHSTLFVVSTYIPPESAVGAKEKLNFVSRCLFFNKFNIITVTQRTTCLDHLIFASTVGIQLTSTSTGSKQKAFFVKN